MSTLAKDPLLSVARLILYFILGVLAIGFVGAVIGLPTVLIVKGKVVAAIMSEGATAGVYWAIPAVLALAIGMIGLSFMFFLHLKRIVDSVALQDPFVPQNAQRLTAMAWLMLAIQVLAVPASSLAYFIAQSMEHEHVSAEVGIDFSGIIMVITLFILARVFRKGTEMREELEGTV